MASSTKHEPVLGPLGQSIIELIRIRNFASAKARLREAKSQGRESKAFYHSLISACTKQIGLPSDVLWLVECMQEGGYKPNVVTFNCILSAFAKVGDVRETNRIFETMLTSFGVKPNHISYNTMIHGSKHLGASAAEDWLIRMLQDSVTPDAASISIVIDAFAKESQIQSAEFWLNQSQAVGLDVQTFAYNSLLSAYAKSNELQRCNKLYLAMNARQVQPSATTFNCLIHICSKQVDLPRAEMWFSLMLSHNISPDVVSYGSMLNVCAKAKDFQRARFWLDTMLASGVRPNIRCFNCLIQAAAEIRDLSMAQHWLNMMLQEGLEPDSFTHRFMQIAQKFSSRALPSPDCSTEIRSQLSSASERAPSDTPFVFDVSAINGSSRSSDALALHDEILLGSLRQSSVANLQTPWPELQVEIAGGKILITV